MDILKIISQIIQSWKILYIRQAISEKKLDLIIDCVILTVFFGHVCNVQQLKQILKKYNLLLTNQTGVPQKLLSYEF